MESFTQHPNTQETHMSEEFSGAGKSDGRQREHARRNARQEEILFPAYRRVMHRAHVEAELRRLANDAPTGPASEPSDE